MPGPTVTPEAESVVVEPEQTAIDELEMLPADGVPEQPGGAGWVSEILSITAQKSPALRMTCMRKKIGRPAGGVNVRGPLLTQVELEAFVNDAIETQEPVPVDE